VTAPQAPTSDVRHYVYVVIDITDPQRAPVHTAPSRRAAREWLQWQEEADNLRVRRAALRIFES
jgi:hypothetical protein